MPRTFFIETLGCKLNQFESEAIQTQLLQRGWSLLDDASQADVILVNTCTVTEKAHLKSLKISTKFERLTARLILIMGCATEHLKKDHQWDKRVILVPNQQKNLIPRILEQEIELKDLDSLSGDRFDFGSDVHLSRTRGFLKIQDGCDVKCSYCIVPHVRGKAVSRNYSEVVASFIELIRSGVKEVVLTGINISRYRDEGKNLTDLIHRLITTPGDFRIRLSSLEPDQFSPSFFELFAHPKIASHVHLSLQSGSDRILEAMHRTYDARAWLNIVENLRSACPLIHISTDVIVGFPGETDEDFEQTLNVLHQAGVGKVHQFPFSVRKNTPAASLTNHVPDSVIQLRLKQLKTLSDYLIESYQKSLVGLRERLLIERIGDGQASGWISRYIYLRMEATPTMRRNQWVDGVIRFYSQKTKSLELVLD